MRDFVTNFANQHLSKLWARVGIAAPFSLVVDNGWFLSAPARSVFTRVCVHMLQRAA